MELVRSGHNTVGAMSGQNEILSKAEDVADKVIFYLILLKIIFTVTCESRMKI